MVPSCQAGQSSEFRFDKSLEEQRMLKKAAALVLACASISAWLGCGQTKSRFFFAAVPTSNDIVAYREDPNAGVLTQLSGSPISAGSGVEALALHPSGKYLYAANSGSNNISLYTVATTGGLTEVTPRTNAGTSPTLLITDAPGSLLYAANSGSNDISVYSISSSTGELTPVPQCFTSSNCTATTTPIGFTALNIALAPSGKFLYVTGEEQLAGVNEGIIEVFPVSNGVLGTPVAGSPFFTGNLPFGLVIDSAGSHLYTANKQDNSISAFTINSNGSLAALGTAIGETFTGPVSLLIDKSGKYLYVANQGSSNVAAYGIGSDGGLTLLTGSPFSTGSGPSVLASDSSGNYFFVGYSSGMQSYTLTTSSGSLTSIASYSLTASGTPTSIVVTP
jgi:6-phosphogluconolactonase (cycloisomerase 2 family)